MQIIRWLIGASVLAAVIAFILLRPLAFPLSPDAPHSAFVVRVLHILILASALCLFRVLRGPTAADRIVAIDMFGVLIVGFCAVVSIATRQSWYIDIGIAWALQSFIGTLALAKHLEGKTFDE